MFNAEGCSSQNQLSCTTSNVNYRNNTKFINNSIVFREILSEHFFCMLRLEYYVVLQAVCTVALK